MKKLMFAAAVAACATVGLADGVTSANIVGYASSELRYGSIGLSAQFIGLGEGGELDLQDIKCNDEASDSVSFSILNSTGLAGDSYYWINWYDPTGEGEVVESCWVDGSYEKVVGFKVQPGDGLWVAGASSDQIFQSSGQVNKSDVTVQLRYGSTLTGNPTPVQIDLQDIRCGEGCSDSVSFSVLNETGLAGDSYYWIDWYDPTGEGTEIEACWVDGAYEKVVGYKVEPGQALWVAGADDTQAIIFPGVEL